MELIEANITHLEMTLEWANDSLAREMFFSSKPISLEEHTAWFTKNLTNPNSRLYIGIDEIPVGLIRFDIEGSAATVSLNVSKTARGNGYGEKLVRLGTDKILKEIDSVTAFIKKVNIPSIVSFKRAGYKDAGDVEEKGVPCVKMVCDQAI